MGYEDLRRLQLPLEKEGLFTTLLLARSRKMKWEQKIEPSAQCVEERKKKWFPTLWSLRERWRRQLDAQLFPFTTENEHKKIERGLTFQRVEDINEIKGFKEENACNRCHEDAVFSLAFFSFSSWFMAFSGAENVMHWGSHTKKGGRDRQQIHGAHVRSHRSVILTRGSAYDDARHMAIHLSFFLQNLNFFPFVCAILLLSLKKMHSLWKKRCVWVGGVWTGTS